jgi:putative iron-regulated protein
MNHRRHLLDKLAVGLCAGLIAPWAVRAHAQSSAPTTEAVLRHYGALVNAGYEDTLAGAQTLQPAIRAFVAAPSADTLATAKEAWLSGRELYGLNEAFRFYGGPIDDDKGPEGRLGHWSTKQSAVTDKTASNAASANGRSVASP